MTSAAFTVVPVAAPVLLSNIDVSDNHRIVDPEAVNRIAESVQEIGLQYPISVVRAADGLRLSLVAGRHRLEAFRKLVDRI